MDSNNKYMGKKSAKLRRIVPLKLYAMELIDNSQKIKRLSRYYTRTPLLNRGVGYNGDKVKQPDLVDSLRFPIENDNVSETADKRILFDYAFSGEVLSERQISIYVHCHKSTFNPNMVSGRLSYGVDNIIGKHFFNIDIIYPIEFNQLDSLYEERANSIACEIVDLLDEKTVEGEAREFTGDCTFHLAGDVTDLRVGTSGYMGMTIPFYVTVLGGHVDEDELGGESRYD